MAILGLPAGVDPYGRTLGRVFIPIDGAWIDLAAQLLEEKHARPYAGGEEDPLGVSARVTAGGSESARVGALELDCV